MRIFSFASGSNCYWPRFQIKGRNRDSWLGATEIANSVSFCLVWLSKNFIPIIYSGGLRANAVERLYGATFSLRHAFSFVFTIKNDEARTQCEKVARLHGAQKSLKLDICILVILVIIMFYHVGNSHLSRHANHIREQSGQLYRD